MERCITYTHADGSTSTYYPDAHAKTLEQGREVNIVDIILMHSFRHPMYDDCLRRFAVQENILPQKHTKEEYESLKQDWNKRLTELENSLESMANSPIDISFGQQNI